MRPEVSVVMSTFNRASVLNTTLQALRRQQAPFAYEIIVVNDGPNGEETEAVCHRYEVCYTSTGNIEYRNPGFARNEGYKRARGRVLVSVSDDVVCSGDQCLLKLAHLRPGTFNIATVFNARLSPGEARLLDCYTGPERPSPLFFLGSMLREHCYAIGGNCEEFTRPGFEDNWFGDCLIRGLGLIPVFHEDIVGYHQDHERVIYESYKHMEALYHRKRLNAAAGKEPWIGGKPWPLG